MQNVSANVPMAPRQHRLTEEQRKNFLSNEAIYHKVQEIASRLTKSLKHHIDVLINIPIGAKFQDVETQQVFVYEAVVQPYKHSELTMLVLETAQQNVSDLVEMSYFIISEDLSYKAKHIITAEDIGVPPVLQSPHMLISGKDFVKYFAMEKWVLLNIPVKPDPNEILQGERLFLP